ncbi:MAG: 50S ribosomal protein L11 methyltransferase [Candidatus Thermochlorobacter sp.]
MEKKAYVEISLPIDAEHFDVAIALLSQMGYETFWEDGDTLRTYMPVALWNAEQEVATQTALTKGLGKPVAMQVTFLEERNWNAEWEKTLVPIEVSSRIVIVQSGKTVPNLEGRLAIEINPKMSFGTGYHETTRLMIRTLEQTVQPTDVVLDIGTGTGVLAIAARKLGNRNPILALDNDEWAIENALENIAVNKCSDIEVQRLDARSELERVLLLRPWTLILANLNRNVLEGLLPKLATHAPQAKLMLSGILKYERNWLQQRLCQLHYNVLSMSSEGEWLCALVAQTNEHALLL